MHLLPSARLLPSTCWILVLAAACGGGDPVSSDPVETTSVSVQDRFFSPPNILVDPGATVTWTWVGSELHDVVWVSADLDDSPLQSEDEHAVTMPQAPGTYAYYCSEHGSPTSGMRGSVIVE